MLEKLKGWRRIATRYDRCPSICMAAFNIVAIVTLQLWSMGLEPSQ